MNTNPSASIRTAALSLAIALAVAACGGNDSTPAADGGTSAPGGSTAAGDQVAAQITGAGSTFFYPLVSRWSADYNAATGAKVNYQSIGSGGGIAQIKAETVDFGASDAPLTSAELDEAGLLQFPVVIGGVVPVVNVPGIEPGELRLTGPLLADIYMGKVATWNDPAIAAVNPGLELPSGKINLVQRSDGSGTTFNFTNYLAKVSPEWNDTIGEGKSVQWPDGVGGKGNEGVASYVQQIEGSIGYVELAYALQNQMSYAMLENAAGNFVAPSAETFQAAAATADWAGSEDFNLVITNATGEQAWPIAATVFALMYAEPKDPQRSAATREFFTWALENGQEQASTLDYVPLPPELVGQVESYWAAEFKGAPQQ
ncbi:phosphate ABC transporter substrate-binding protein PstS [Novilysobacter spongiicola]|uniref:Phosphate-binding protein PstS n=1 Tax=Lysobacter spongiicola DSM 21749 TaxID=1122188 RepID=A0A1T4MWH1_9GAMM|nr:phosphate ABC transporter substrate-binding protein PstS [Lysobacter spongiicola]SJZ71399.1 phosphate transport system substrate-binding protein [Lysobacter spongiicola DSM 21749]